MAIEHIPVTFYYGDGVPNDSECGTGTVMYRAATAWDLFPHHACLWEKSTGGFTSKAAVTRGFDIVLVNWLLDVEQTAHLLVNRDATVIEWSPMGFPQHVSDTQEPEQCHEPGPVLQFTQSLSGLSSWRWWQISHPYYQNYLSVCITQSSNRYTNAILLVLHYINQNMDMHMQGANLQAAYKTFQ